ncbi:hypothetical protein SO802_001141 [Lithocarpus litseifolius]|uniref:F-box associated beta-propeller type 1 domain-containing protein n=1 Tax=Lithocarpus litseifolius TaxID=425828 RepID=A0AAW2DW83_9ROSI
MQELNILGACINGAICLYDRPCFLISNQHPNGDLYRIALRNPANKEFKVLPTSHVNCPSHVDYTYEGFKFGYDHKSSDYKVDRIVSFGDDSIVGPDRTLLYEQPWPHGDTELIISFDMSDEVFQIIRMPELEDVSGMNLKTISVLNDCLALILYSAEETVTVKNFDIWMMYEYGVKESWIKQLVVGPALVGIERPLGFAKNGELLLVANNGQVVLYNFGSGETKNLEVRGLPGSFLALQTITYVESLVSITNRIVF